MSKIDALTLDELIVMHHTLAEWHRWRAENAVRAPVHWHHKELAERLEDEGHSLNHQREQEARNRPDNTPGKP